MLESARRTLLRLFGPSKGRRGRNISRPIPPEVDYTPRPQILYHYQKLHWQAIGKTTAASNSFSKFRLITWNINSLAPGSPVRMAAALQHLEQLVSEAPPELPVAIMLQEMIPIYLKLIQDARWVRERFNVTDVNTSNWQGGGSGTIMLIDRRLPVKTVYRVSYKTRLRRDGLFVDLVMRPADDERNQKVVIRLCNTHLESLRSPPPLRPAQVAVVAEQIRDPSVRGGLVAGDFSAIQDLDRTLHSANDLKDAYLDLGGQEDSEEGYTWGQQVSPRLRERYGCIRMDKILYCGDLRVENLQRIGVGVKVKESERAKLRNAGAMEFVTDHYGLMADVIVV
ncbi:MAG: hypothetical protein Q9208_005974 [Pyrenodesmia sp. 3 TL-2023]